MLQRADLCIKCKTNPAKANKLTCKECLTNALKYQKAKREKANLYGLCITCCKNEPEKDKTRCRRCINKYKLPLITKLFRNARARAKKSGLEFTIQETDIIIPARCPILDLPLVENEQIAKPNSYSLDRIDSKRGYVPGNVQVISHRANQIKNDASVQELEMLLRYMQNLQLSVK